MDELKIKKIVVGQIEANCYLLVSNNELAVIDPGDEYEKIVVEIETISPRHSRPPLSFPRRRESLRQINSGGNPDLQIIPKYILLTHGHFDHVGAVRDLKEKYGFQIVLAKKEEGLYKDVDGQKALSGMDFTYPGDPDILVKNDDLLEFDGEKIKVLETPGHTKGSVCYLVNNNLFSGDTLFPQRHGMTSFPTGSQVEMNQSLKRLFSLEDDTKVFPGHYEETTLGEAKKHFRESGFGI